MPAEAGDQRAGQAGVLVDGPAGVAGGAGAVLRLDAGEAGPAGLLLVQPHAGQVRVADIRPVVVDMALGRLPQRRVQRQRRRADLRPRLVDEGQGVGDLVGRARRPRRDGQRRDGQQQRQRQAYPQAHGSPWLGRVGRDVTRRTPTGEAGYGNSKARHPFGDAALGRVLGPVRLRPTACAPARECPSSRPGSARPGRAAPSPPPIGRPRPPSRRRPRGRARGRRGRRAG